MKSITITDEQLKAVIECVKRDCEPFEIRRSRPAKELEDLEDALANLRVAAEAKDNINTFGVNPTIE